MDTHIFTYVGSLRRRHCSCPLEGSKDKEFLEPKANAIITPPLQHLRREDHVIYSLLYVSACDPDTFMLLTHYVSRVSGREKIWNRRNSAILWHTHGVRSIERGHSAQTYVHQYVHTIRTNNAFKFAE